MCIAGFGACVELGLVHAYSLVSFGACVELGLVHV